MVATIKTQSASALLRNNLLNLEALNSRYAQEWDFLRTNPETTALEARSLGYLAENEVALRLSIGDVADPPPSAGSRISFESESLLTEKSIKHFALFLTIASAAAGFVFRLNAGSSRKQNHREIRVHVATR